MGKRVKQKVVGYETCQIYPGYSGSWSQCETLECGHEVFNKGSVGRASFRFCKACEGLRSGEVTYENDTITFWDPETEMPKTVPYQPGLVKDFDEEFEKDPAKRRWKMTRKILPEKK